MASVALVSVSAVLRGLLDPLRLPLLTFASSRALHAPGGTDPQAIEAIIIGEAVDDPIQAVSHAFRFDPALSVIVMASDDAQCERIQAALRFSPRVGKDVVCVDVSRTDVPSVIAAAIARTRARRRHRKVLAAVSASTETDTAASSPKVRERYADHLMELAPVGIVAADEEGRVVTANAVAQKILGRSERELLGLRLGGPELGADEGGWSRLLASSSTEQRDALTFARAVSGQRWVLEARAVTVPMDSGRSFLIVFDDVTDRARTEEERQRAFEKAEQASRLKDEFIATMSHELRTPLNAIVGWTELLLKGTLSPERRTHAMKVIQRNARAQTVLVEDLLDISRIMAGKLRLALAPANMATIVQNSLDALAPAAAAKRLDIEPAIGVEIPPIVADADRLHQVVWNLLSNAIKFTPERGKIEVFLRRVEGNVELTVRDTGAGIPPEMLSFVFDPFRQVEGGITRSQGGLGLGLAIVRRLVELHGGTVTAQSDGVGKGASFVVRLPSSLDVAGGHTSTERESHPVARESPDAASFTRLPDALILVVDDDEDARELLRLTLESAGARVCTADSAKAARVLLEERRPDLVISDLGMPEEDGFQLLAYVRRRFSDQLPVAAFTAFATRWDRARTTSEGFVAHLIKPLDSTELLNTVGRLLARR